MPEIGQSVTFNPADGRNAVEAEITAVNDDGSVSITYPHPKAPEVLATAEGVRPGRGAYQFEEESSVDHGEAPAINSREHLDGLETELEILRARIEVLQPLADAADPDRLAEYEKQKADDVAALETLRAEIFTLTKERDDLAVAVAAQASNAKPAAPDKAKG